MFLTAAERIHIINKFSPDKSFGIIKKLYNSSNIDCFNDLIQCVVKSSPAGLHSAVSGADVTWNDWTSYLHQFFKPLPKITNYHHFICHSNGTIAAKLFAHTDPQVISLQTATLETPVAFMMEELEEEGLSLERQ